MYIRIPRIELITAMEILSEAQDQIPYRNIVEAMKILVTVGRRASSLR